MPNLGPFIVSGLSTGALYALSAVGTSRIAFGGLNWALDGVAAPVAARHRIVNIRDR